MNTIFQSYKHEIDTLEAFRADYQQYIDDFAKAKTKEENAKLAAARQRLHERSVIVQQYAKRVGVDTVYKSIRPDAPTISADVILALFDLRLMGLSTKHVIAVLDKTLGLYRHRSQQNAKHRRNPIHWLGEVIRIPFHIIQWAGFDAEKIELSFGAKLYKATIASITLLIILVPFAESALNLYEKRAQIQSLVRSAKSTVLPPKDNKPQTQQPTPQPSPPARSQN